MYGPVINVSTFVQCCAYSVGQASEPIISARISAAGKERSHRRGRLAICAVDGRICSVVFWTALERGSCPNPLRASASDVLSSPTETMLGDGAAVHHPRVNTSVFPLLPLQSDARGIICATTVRPHLRRLVVSVARGHLSIEFGALILIVCRMRCGRGLRRGSCHGAGLGSCRSLVMLTHFASRKNTLRLDDTAAARRKSRLTKRGHRRIIMSEF